MLPESAPRLIPTTFATAPNLSPQLVVTAIGQFATVTAIRGKTDYVAVKKLAEEAREVTA